MKSILSSGYVFCTYVTRILLQSIKTYARVYQLHLYLLFRTDGKLRTFL